MDWDEEDELERSAIWNRRSDLILTRPGESREEEEPAYSYSVVESEQRPPKQRPVASKRLSAEDRRKAKAARSKYRLGEEVDDNAKLVVAIAFYPHRLQPGKTVPAKPIEEFIRQKKGFRCYAKVARRVLHVFSVWDRSTGELMLRLPTERGLCTRLVSVGLNLRLPSVRKQFDQLNGDLEIDDAVKAFAQGHPILERVKLWLRRDYIPTVEELGGVPACAEEDKQEDALPPEESWKTGGPVAHIGAPAYPEPFQYEPVQLGYMIEKQRRDY